FSCAVAFELSFFEAAYRTADRPGDRLVFIPAHRRDKTLPRREPDSNHRSRSCERLFWALPIGDGGTKGGATYRFRSETAMLAWSGCPQPLPSRRDREFESVFLQQRVCLRSDLCGADKKTPRACADFCVSGDVRWDVLAAAGLSAECFL